MEIYVKRNFELIVNLDKYPKNQYGFIIIMEK